MGMLGPVLGVAAQEDNGEQSRLKWGLCPCLLNLPFQFFCITIAIWSLRRPPLDSPADVPLCAVDNSLNILFGEKT